MKKSIFMGLVAVLGLIGCTRNQEIDIQENGLTLVAKTESPADTKTVVEEGVHVFWEPGDEIAVFMGEKMAKFSTDITAASGTATFKGTFGDSKWPEEPDIWAVYPFSEDVTFEGETITTVLPSEQVAREGSFGKDMNLSIAHSTGTSLQFYNVGGGIRFSVTEEGIKKVMFEGLSGEIISGKVKIGFDENGTPVVKEVSGGSQFITLLPPSGKETFEPGAWYYIVAIPGSLEGGYKLRFYKNSDYARKVSEKKVEIKRSIFGNIERADKGIEYGATTTKFPETDEEWNESDMIAQDVSERVNSLVSTINESGEIYDSIEEIVHQTLQLDNVVDVKKIDDSSSISGISIQLRDNSWINYLFDIPGYIDTEEEDAKIAKESDVINHGILKSQNTNKVVLNRTSPEKNKALIVAPYHYRGVDGYNIQRGVINVDFDYAEEQLNSIGYTLVPLKNNDISLSYLTGDQLCQYGLIMFATHGGTALNTGSGIVTTTCIDTGIRVKKSDNFDNLLNRADLARVYYYNVNDGHYWLTGSWIWATLSNHVAGAFGNAIVIVSSCVSYRNSDLAYCFLDRGAAAYYGNYEKSAMPLGGALLKSMIHSLCCGLDVERAANYVEYDPLFTHSSFYGLSIRQFPFSFHGTLRDDVSEAFLVNPYPKNLFRRVNDRYVYFSWDQNKTIGNYSFDVYVDGKKIKTTYNNNCSIYTDIWGKHEWYVVANLTLNGETVASYRTDGKPFTINDQTCVTPGVVDLGLSVKWGSFNLGAKSRDDYGYYYAWGDKDRITEDINWDDYIFETPGYNDEWHITKYTIPDGEMKGIWYSGSTFIGDNKTTLDLEDDAARVRLGDHWRMPTWDEYLELKENCIWEWTTIGGINGYRVTSKVSGFENSWIFIPASGAVFGNSPGGVGVSGSYWTSTLCPYYTMAGRSFDLNSSAIDYSYTQRTFGYTIRPVYDNRVRVTSVQLNRTSLQLTEGTTTLLIATVSPLNATDKRVNWVSSNEEVASVSSDGLVHAIRPGTAVISVTTVDGKKEASCSVTVKEEALPIMVDLGLSVKWRSFNLGASRPEDYGDCYAWGEISTKDSFEWSNYKWSKGSNSTLTKYCTNSIYGYNGFTDGKTDLEFSDDAAYQKLKGNWRMPTSSEFNELINNCNLEWVSRRGIIGLKITSKVPGYTDKWIFMPQGGFWARTGYGNDAADLASIIKYFESDSVEFVTIGSFRCYGYPIRPVYDD